MAQQPSDNKNLEVATLAAGCFWCTEAAFSIIKGVERIEPGYTGGTYLIHHTNRFPQAQQDMLKQHRYFLTQK